MSKPFIEQKPLLPPNFESKPPLPVPPDYQPPNSQPYIVKEKDDWAKVALGKMDVKALIEFNFKTVIPSQVNWYLHNYVGCTRISADKSNFGFSAKDEHSPWSPRAGTIYVPAAFPLPVPVPNPVPGPEPTPGLGPRICSFPPSSTRIPSSMTTSR